MADTDIPLSELQSIAAMPINRAWVCECCHTVANRPQCPYCLGESVATLEQWANGEKGRTGKTKEEPIF